MFKRCIYELVVQYDGGVWDACLETEIYVAFVTMVRVLARTKLVEGFDWTIMFLVGWEDNPIGCQHKCGEIAVLEKLKCDGYFVLKWMTIQSDGVLDFG